MERATRHLELLLLLLGPLLLLATGLLLDALLRRVECHAQLGRHLRERRRTFALRGCPRRKRLFNPPATC